MKQNVRKKALCFVNWLAGLCAVAGVIASLHGLYGMFQVWTGKITSVPLIGELTLPGDVETGVGMLFYFFKVCLGGMAYGFMWVIPTGIALAVLMFISDKLKKTLAAQLGPIP